MLQNIVVIAVVVLAGAWLVRRALRKRGSASGCGCSCAGGSCSSGKMHFTPLDGRGCDRKC